MGSDVPALWTACEEQLNPVVGGGAALAAVVAVISSLHEVARLPYLRRRTGLPIDGQLGIFPLALIVGTILAVISGRTSQPGRPEVQRRDLIGLTGARRAG